MDEEQEGILGTENSQPENQPDTTPGQDSGVDTKSDEPEEEIIEGHKKLFGDKFKTYQGFVKSYREIEKYKSKLENEKGQYGKQFAELQEKINELQSKVEQKNQAGDLSEDSKLKLEEANLKFQEEFATNPLGAINRLMGIYLTQLKAEKEEETYVNNFKEEEKTLKKKYGDKWDSMLPELQKLAVANPAINSLKHLVAIYKDQQEEKEEKNKQSAQLKDEEKRKAFTESGGGGNSLSEDLATAIGKAKSVKELDAIASRMKK